MRIFVAADKVTTFLKSWPRARLGHRDGYNFEWSMNGDLVGIEYQGPAENMPLDWEDEAALLALSLDAESLKVGSLVADRTTVEEEAPQREDKPEEVLNETCDHFVPTIVLSSLCVACGGEYQDHSASARGEGDEDEEDLF